jgi:hypothetical protein
MAHPMSVDRTLPAKSEQNKNITQKCRATTESALRTLGFKKVEPTLASINFIY